MRLPLEEMRKITGKGLILENEPLSRYTSFRIGGECTVALPADREELTALLRFAREKGIPVFILGNGTNVLCADEGWDGLVVRTKNLSDIRIEGERLVLGGGTLLSKAAAAAAAGGLGGMEFAHGIPGSVGGAVAMNAGAYGGEMKDCVTRTLCLTPEGEELILEGEAHRFSYRHSAVTDNPGTAVLETELLLVPKDRGEIEEKMRDFSSRRRASQPLELPSAGSVFKRPEGHFVGAMVQECGLKGRRVGGAQVSPKHAGFIVNTGGATASDVLALIEIVRKEVFARFGVSLECEIRPLGIGREEI